MSVEVFEQTPPARPYRFELLPEDALASALQLLEQPEDEGGSREGDEAVARGIERALAFADAHRREQRAALVLLSELSGLEVGEMARRLEEHGPRFRSMALSRLLHEKSWEAAHYDPSLAHEISRLALRATELLDAGELPDAVWNDMRAESWAAAAATRRLTGDPIGAQAAFAEASKFLAAGSGTLMTRAELLLGKASLSCDLERYDDASRAVDQALVILRTGGRAEEVARALLVKGRLELEREDPETARALLEEALGLLQGSTDRSLVLAGRHNLAACFVALGRDREARREIRAAESTARLLARPLSLVRLRWLEGRRAESRGNSAAAERSYRAAVDAFRAHGLTAQAAAAAFDLTRLTLRRGRIGRFVQFVPALLSLLRRTRRIPRRRPVSDPSW